MLIAAICIVFAGAALLIWGIRGRRIDDHPLCRKCGYDLFNRPTNSSRCSECGAMINRARAIRVGHRRRQKGPVSLGVCALLGGLAGIGAPIYLGTHESDVLRRLPVSWVVYRATSPVVPQADLAMAELNRRLGAGKLTREQIQFTVARILQWQANPKFRWSAACGDFVERSIALGDVTDEQRHQYITQAFTSAAFLRVRPKVRRGAPLLLRLVVNDYAHPNMLAGICGQCVF